MHRHCRVVQRGDGYGYHVDTSRMKETATMHFFLVLKGIVTIETELGNVILEPGELYVVPRGVQHRPVAQEEAHILLIEPRGTPNTGDARTAARKIEI